MSQKKVGIITFYHNSENYGGLLQAYALVYKIKKLGYECEQISYEGSNLPNLFIDKIVTKGVMKKIILIVPKKVKNFALNLKDKQKIKSIQSGLQLRSEAFENFRLNRIPHSKTYNQKTINNSVANYDIFVCGSDQIWNPIWTDNSYYLDFVPSNKIKISYAASFGVNQLSPLESKDISKIINRIDRISVRESEGKEILKEEFGLNAELVLDPTLLLKKQEWDALAEEVPINYKYMFVYLLGDSIKHRKLIKKYAIKLNLKIVYLPHIFSKYCRNDENFADTDLYDVGPEKFISLIKNADIIITDSFHGCVFSIIYEKKFWALKRHADEHASTMNSRLYSLFSLLGIKERIISEEKLTIEPKLFNNEIDYIQCKKVLSICREQSLTYLKEIDTVVNFSI